MKSFNQVQDKDSYSSAVVNHSTTNPKVKGSNPATLSFIHDLWMSPIS